MDQSSRSIQTTVIVADGDHTAEAAALAAILGDEYTYRRVGGPLPVIRIVSAEPHRLAVFDDGDHDNIGRPFVWKCHEKSMSGARWITHFGVPDEVFPISKLEQAILGRTTHDDGGMADLVLLCGTAMEMIQLTANALSTLNHSRLLGPSTAPPLVLSTTSNIRTFDMILRRIHWGTTSHRRIAVCGFTKTPWFCRVVKKKVVLLIHNSPQSTPTLAVYCDRDIQKCVSTWTHITERLQRPSFSPPDINAPSKYNVSQGAHMLFQFLQDSSIILDSCTLFSLLHKKYSQKYHYVGQIALRMYAEYLLLCERLQLLELAITDCVLIGLVGSRAWIELTSNGMTQIVNRLEAGSQQPLRARRLLEFLVTRNAENQWGLSQNASPFQDDTKENGNSIDMTRIDDVLRTGLLLWIGLAQLAGLNIADELPTTLTVTRELQLHVGKSYINRQGNVVCDSRKLFDTLAPQATGIADMDGLVRRFCASPIQQQQHEMKNFLLKANL